MKRTEKEKQRERPMLDTADVFIIKAQKALKDNKHEDVKDLRDDVDKALCNMRDAIEGAYESDEKIMVLPSLAWARTKSDAVRFYMDLFAETGAITKGDSIELQSMLDELKEEMTRIIKDVDPRFDKWREEYKEEFGERPEDIDKID